jgi:hypothetical protein
MKVTLTQKDWLLISAYLDGRLSDVEKTSFESRLNADPGFNSAYRELQYTRELLKSLPHKRAPRNFTLSPEYIKKRSFKWGLNRFFGLASAASAVALVAIFAWTNLSVFQAKMAAPVSFNAALPESAVATGSLDNDEASNAPMIITWGQQGLGGERSGASSFATGMGGYGGGGAPSLSAPSSVPQPKIAPVAPTESPLMSSELASTPDPSTLILGLPEPGTEGETLQLSENEVQSVAPRMLASTIWMIGLGAGALLFALLALFLRKR